MTSPLALFGAFLRGAFGLPKSDKQAVDRVKDLARAALRASPDTAFAINEIARIHAGWPGIVTVILVMEPGVETRTCTIAKPLAEVTEQDIREALDR